MLRREPPVRLDMRFISRLARDSFGLSSASDEASVGESGTLPEAFFIWLLAWDIRLAMESDVASLGTDDRLEEKENRVRSTFGLVGLESGRMVDAALDMRE
jgi:hypothetical protein